MKVGEKCVYIVKGRYQQQMLLGTIVAKKGDYCLVRFTKGQYLWVHEEKLEKDRLQIENTRI